MREMIKSGRLGLLAGVLLTTLILLPARASALSIVGGDYLHASNGTIFYQSPATFTTPTSDTITLSMLHESGDFQYKTKFGIYGFTFDSNGLPIIGNTLQIFNGPDTTGASVTLNYNSATNDITVTSPTTGATVNIGPNFGFYYDSSYFGPAGGLYYSQPTLSSDQAQHFKFFNTSGNTSPDLQGAALVLGMEDLNSSKWDQNYSDMVVGITGVDPPPAPVPEPATLLLLGLGLAAFGLYFRRHRV